MILPRILHALTSAETWTNIGVFAVGWALAEVRALVVLKMKLRRWEREAMDSVLAENSPLAQAIEHDIRTGRARTWSWDADRKEMVEGPYFRPAARPTTSAAAPTPPAAS